MSSQFIFLLATERSGSNLITRLLDAHPLVCGPSPIHLAWNLMRYPGRYGCFSDDSVWAQLTLDVLGLFNSKLGYWLTEWTHSELLQVAPRTVGSLLRAIYEREAAFHGAQYVVVKAVHAWHYAPLLLAEFEGAKFLWQVRDPRDVALSWKRQPEILGEVPLATQRWCDDQRGYLNLWHQLRPTGRIDRLHYEELVTDPPGTLTQVCQFLGLDYSQDMLSFHTDPLTRRNAGVAGGWENLASPIQARSVSGFLEGLTREELSFIEWRADPLMSILGYRFALPPCNNGEELEHRLKADETLMSRVDYGAKSPRTRALRLKRFELRAEMARRPEVILREPPPLMGTVKDGGVGGD